ncbi:hypothetical protein Q1695_014555 [Nippostrongylus brasiliensis]|nr:hypothetical protein Q1695_014555 [Nippostrongylus brasiliensis]
MRAFVILLLLCAIVSADLFDKSKIKEKFKALKGKLTDKVKAALDKLGKKFNTTALAEFREKLACLKDKIGTKLTLTKEKLAEVARRLKVIDKVDHVQPGGDSIDAINQNVGVGEALYQGDIVLTREQSEEIVEGIIGESRSKRQAFRDSHYPMTTWPKKEVPYFFDENASASTKSVFNKAAMLWQKDTCLSIYEDNNAPEAIQVFEGQGCWSYAGKIGGKQNLSLGQFCDNIGTAAHELGHALGFFHTHSRHDRDNHVLVVKDNIREDWLAQFTVETKERNNNYGLPYDYGSLMQYGATTAVKEQKPNTFSIVPNDTVYIETLGSPFISFIDLYMMNIHYNCTEKCAKVDWARCRNHGFPHPRDCSRCICPGGYGGDYCDERPRGCGQTIVAEAYPQQFTDTIGNKSAGGYPREDFVMCNYWITAPQGKKVKVRLLEFKPDRIAVDGCLYAGVEFKWQADQRLTGSRHCSKYDAGTVFTSTSNIMPVITYNRFYESETTFEYSYV